jgi:hypothetical protein
MQARRLTAAGDASRHLTAPAVATAGLLTWRRLSDVISKFHAATLGLKPAVLAPSLRTK